MLAKCNTLYVTIFNLDGNELFSELNPCCAHGGQIIYIPSQTVCSYCANKY